MCAHPGCTHDDIAHRPYAHTKDGVPSVTTITGTLDNGKARSFGWAASLIAAVTAVHETARWFDLPTTGCTHEKNGLCKACRFLRSEHDRVWSAKAALGSHVHHLALSWAKGDPVDVDTASEPYMDALAAFYADTQPHFIELERTVRYKDTDERAYRGQFDFVATLLRDGTRRRGLWDIKTGGYWPVEQTLQLAAYRYATSLTVWGGKTETVDTPMPEVDEAGVLLLGADGGYRLVPLPADGLAFVQFRNLLDVWQFARAVEQWNKEQEAA